LTEYPIAGLGKRVVALFIDSIVLVAWVLLNYIIVLILVPEQKDLVCSFVQLFFLILTFGFVPWYFVKLQSDWDGQTIGKKLLGIRVMVIEGHVFGTRLKLGDHPNLVSVKGDYSRLGERFLLIGIDILIGWTAMIGSPFNQRWGDSRVGTIVVND